MKSHRPRFLLIDTVIACLLAVFIITILEGVTRLPDYIAKYALLGFCGLISLLGIFISVIHILAHRESSKTNVEEVYDDRYYLGSKPKDE